MNTDNNIQVIEGDLSNPEHAENFLKLTAAYMADPMGESVSWTEEQKTNLVQDLNDHPVALILFAKVNEQYAGICTCFYV